MKTLILSRDFYITRLTFICSLAGTDLASLYLDYYPDISEGVRKTEILAVD